MGPCFCRDADSFEKSVGVLDPGDKAGGSGLLCRSIGKPGEKPWGNSRWGSRCRGSRIRGCCAAAAAMSTTSCCRAWRYGHVLRSPHAHARIRAIDTAAREGRRPACSAVLTGADWQASGWGDLPVAGRLRGGATARPPYRPRYPGAGQGPGALGRRLRRLRRRRDPRSRRHDAAELIEVEYEPLPAVVSHRRGDSSPARRRSGTIARTISASSIRSATRRRPRPPSRGPPIRPAPARDQPGHRRDDGAARLHRRLRPRRRPLHDLHRPAAHPRLPLRPRRQIAQGAREQGARRRRRYRRQLRHEVGDLQRGRAGAAGLEADSAGRSNGPARARRPSSATRRRATTSPRPSWRSTRTGISSASASDDRRRRRLPAGRLQRRS